MIEVLKRNGNNTADIVCVNEVKVGDEFQIGTTVDGKPIIKTVVSINEQRKERGTYKDEANRRMWAKVTY